MLARLIACYGLLVLFPFLSFAQLPELERLTSIEPISIARAASSAITFDDENDIVWLRVDSVFSSVDLKTGEIVTYPTSFRVFDTKMGWSTSTQDIRLWDAPIGRVWRWKPGMDSVVRIDESFNHMNQNGHGAFLDPLNSDIYAFGGYGLWTMKNFLTQFDTTSREWNLIFSKNPEAAPYLSAMALMFRKADASFYIAGGAFSETHLQSKNNFTKPSFGIYRYQRENAEFAFMGEIELPENVNVLHISPTTNHAFHQYGSMVPRFSDKYDAWFVYAYVGMADDRNYTILQGKPRPAILDLKTHRLWVPDLDRLGTNAGLDLIEMIWREKHDDLVVIFRTSNSNIAGNRLVFFKIPMQEFFATFDAQLDRVHPVIPKKHQLPIAFFTFSLLFGGGFIALRTRKKKRTSHERPQPSESAVVASKPSKAILFIREKPELLFQEEDLFSDREPILREFFCALVLEAKIRGKGIETTELDELLFKPRLHDAYIRKMRSLLVKDINYLLKNQFGIEEGVNYFRSPIDRRRSVYTISTETLSIIDIDVEAGLPSALLQKNFYQSLKLLAKPDHPLYRAF